MLSNNLMHVLVSIYLVSYSPEETGTILLHLLDDEALLVSQGLFKPVLLLLDGGGVHGLYARCSRFIFILTVVTCADLLTLRTAPANRTNPGGLTPPLAVTRP